MASTYTDGLGLEKPATGDKTGTWGTMENTIADIIDRATMGNLSITCGSTAYTLTTTDGVASEGQYGVLTFTSAGDPGGNVTVTISPNDQKKCFFIRNTLTNARDLIITQGSGGNVTITNGYAAVVMASGGGATAVCTSVLANIQLSSATISGTLTLSTPLPIASGGTASSTAANARTALGVTATGADTAYNFRANNLSDVAVPATARTNLGVTATGADTAYNFRANNLSDVAVAATARTNLGLGTIATQAANNVNIDGGTIGGVTLDGAITGADQTISAPNLKDYSEEKQDVTASSTTTIDYSVGQVVALSQAVAITTFSITNPPASGKTGAVTIIRTKDNSATARLITWPASVKWPGGTAPTLTSTALCVDIINLITVDGGTTWRGTFALDSR